LREEHKGSPFYERAQESRKAIEDSKRLHNQMKKSRLNFEKQRTIRIENKSSALGKRLGQSLATKMSQRTKSLGTSRNLGAAKAVQSKTAQLNNLQINGYTFKSNGPFQRDLVQAYTGVYNHKPANSNESDIRDFALSSGEYADDLFSTGDVDEANLYKDITTELADVLVGLDPVTGVGRGAYELYIGKNIVTGQALTKTERVFAAFSVLSLGSSNTLKNSVKLASKFGNVTKYIDKAKKIYNARHIPGNAVISSALHNGSTLLSHNNGVFGHVPDEIGQQLAGQTFQSFDKFREAFWKATANSQYVGEFNRLNRANMAKGLAPFARASEHVGKRGVYELHHIIPISKGGPVYDVSNIMIATPKYHVQVLHSKL
jgi:hypothetical protein